MGDEFIFETLSCYTDTLNPHLLKNSKILPCGNRACLTCIEESLLDGIYYCPFDDCKREHVIYNLNQLTDDKTTLLFYQKRTPFICKSIYDRISEKCKNLQSMFRVL